MGDTECLYWNQAMLNNTKNSNHYENIPHVLERARAALRQEADMRQVGWITSEDDLSCYWIDSVLDAAVAAAWYMDSNWLTEVDLVIERLY